MRVDFLCGGVRGLEEREGFSVVRGVEVAVDGFGSWGGGHGEAGCEEDEDDRGGEEEASGSRGLRGFGERGVRGVGKSCGGRRGVCSLKALSEDALLEARSWLGGL